MVNAAELGVLSESTLDPESLTELIAARQTLDKQSREKQEKERETRSKENPNPRNKL